MIEIFERLDEMRRRAKDLIQCEGTTKTMSHELIPLGLALLEVSELFSLLIQERDISRLAPLFDGGQTMGPNLDSRLRYVRDLCSASTYFVRRQAEKLSEVSSSLVEEAQTPGEGAWHELLSDHAPTFESRQEIARLLDDVLEAMLCVSENLRLTKQHNSRSIWREIDRHLTHVVDHFDYAEEMLIQAMRHTET